MKGYLMKFDKVLHSDNLLQNLPWDITALMERIGKQVADGDQWPKNVPVVIEQGDRGDIAYVDPFKFEDRQRVLDGEVVYEVSPLKLLPYASDELIACWWESGRLQDLSGEEVAVTMRAVEQRDRAKKSFEVLRKMMAFQTT
jgi:hypothetical protein